MPQDTTPAPVTPAVSAPSPTPSPAPSSSSPSPTATATASPPGQTVTEAFDKQFTDLEDAAPAAKTDSPSPAPSPTPEPKTSITPPPSTTPKPIEQDEEFRGPDTGTIRELRNFGRRMGDMAKNATNKVKELTAKLEELESRSTVPPDITKIQQDYQWLQKEVEDYRQRLTRTDYSQSKEYEEKYKAPYQEAYLRGRSAVKNLTVRQEDELGEIKTRQGTAEDFDKLYEMSDSQADEAAEKMFGPSARRVILLRDAAKERAESAFNAIKTNTAKFAQEQQQTQAQMAQRRLALTGLWKKANEDLQTKHAKWFGTKDGDTEWNEALNKGRGIAMQRFGSAYAQMSPEQRVILDAQVANRASAFTPMKVLVGRLESKLAEAEKTIEQLRSSGPGKSQPGAAAADTGPSKDWESDFEKKV